MSDRQQYSLVQGSDEWNEFRATHFGASEAAAMLGISPYTTRTELLDLKKTGIGREFSDYVQREILDKGHDVEAKAREIIESEIGEDLYPATYSLGRLSCSCDGITMMEDAGFEHKQLSRERFEAAQRGEILEHDMAQVQQCLLVTGANLWLFVVSDGTAENMAIVRVHADNEWFNRIRAGWAQFEKDLESHELTIKETKPEARAIMALPALNVAVSGEVRASNLAEYRSIAMKRIGEINVDLQTDQDFADAEAEIKFCSGAENDLESTKTQIIGQMVSVDEVIKTINYLKEELRSKRLALEKLVKTEKENRKNQLVMSAKTELDAHIRDLESDLSGIRLQVAVDFGGAIKGKKTLDSMRAEINPLLSNAKIAADSDARRIKANIETIQSVDAQYRSLFPDLISIAIKRADDLHALIDARIAQHENQERERKEREAKAQAEREERIAREAAEKARAEAETVARLEAEQQEAMRQAEIEAEKRKAAADAEKQAAAARQAANDVAVIDHQSEITEFMKTRDFGKNASFIRSALVEFVKFQSAKNLKAAA